MNARIHAVIGLAAAAACARPVATQYAGSWKRVSDTQGEIKLTVKAAGLVELRLARPAIPADSLMKGPGVFRGDTVIFAGAPCEKGEARYQLQRAGQALTITSLGADGCALRHETLVGAWTAE